MHACMEVYVPFLHHLSKHARQHIHECLKPPIHLSRMAEIAARRQNVQWSLLTAVELAQIVKDTKRLQEISLFLHDPNVWLIAYASASERAFRALRQLIWLQTERVVGCLLEGRPLPRELGAIAACSLRENVVTWCVDASGLKDFGTWAGQPPKVYVVNRDIIQVAQGLTRTFSRVAVLNMASARSPGGGYRLGHGAQEEDLHRRSDAFRFTSEAASKFYPIHQKCVVSEGVTNMRGPSTDGYAFLEEPFQVTMISCAAVSRPRLTRDRKYADQHDATTMFDSVRLIVQTAREAGCDAIALSAFGCGAFRNPPEEVAQMFAQVLSANSDVIKCAVFCILNDHNACSHHNPMGNFKPFQDQFGSEEFPTPTLAPPSIPRSPTPPANAPPAKARPVRPTCGPRPSTPRPSTAVALGPKRRPSTAPTAVALSPKRRPSTAPTPTATPRLEPLSAVAPSPIPKVVPFVVPCVVPFRIRPLARPSDADVSRS